MKGADVMIKKTNLTKLIKKGDKVLYGKNNQGQHVISNGEFVAITNKSLPKSLVNKLEKEIEMDKVKNGYILNNFMHVGNIDKKDFDFTKLTKNGVITFEDFMFSVELALDSDTQNKEFVIDTELFTEKMVQGTKTIKTIVKIFYLQESKKFMYFNKDYINTIKDNSRWFTNINEAKEVNKNKKICVSSPYKGITFVNEDKSETFIVLPIRLEDNPFIKKL